MVDRSFTLRDYGFSTFFAPVTLTLTRWPSYTNFPVSIGLPDVKIRDSYYKVFESYRMTDRQTRPKL